MATNIASLHLLHYARRISALNSIEAPQLSVDKSHVPDQIQHPVAEAGKYSSMFR